MSIRLWSRTPSFPRTLRAMTTTSVQVESHEVPGGWVIGGPTRLLDTWAPSPLVLWSPKFRYPDHELTFSLTEGESSAPEPGPGRQTASASRIVFDARFDATANVAHILQNQTAAALCGLEALGMLERHTDLLFVVHPDTPEYAKQLYAALGFETLPTADTIAGLQLRMDPRKFRRRAMAAPILRRHAVRIGLLGDDDTPGPPVFLARRGRRSLTNLEAIEPIINMAGYRTLYAEDLPAADQIRTIANAARIFGLHGAAFGFAMMHNPRQHRVLVECFSCGYASNWVRAICHETGSTWLGGQGDLDLRVLGDVLGLGHPRLHEADSFRLSPATAKALLRAADRAAAIGTPPAPDPIVSGIDGVQVAVDQIGQTWHASPLARLRGTVALASSKLVSRLARAR